MTSAGPAAGKGLVPDGGGCGRHRLRVVTVDAAAADDSRDDRERDGDQRQAGAPPAPPTSSG